MSSFRVTLKPGLPRRVPTQRCIWVSDPPTFTRPGESGASSRDEHLDAGLASVPPPLPGPSRPGPPGGSETHGQQDPAAPPGFLQQFSPTEARVWDPSPGSSP